MIVSLYVIGKSSISSFKTKDTLNDFELKFWSKEILFSFRKLQKTAKIGNVFIYWIRVFFGTKFQLCISNTVLYVLVQFIPGNLFLVRVINLQQCTRII